MNKETVEGRGLGWRESYLRKQGDVVGVKIHVAVAVDKAEATGNKIRLI